jgi:hypothetical protein
MAVLSRAQEYRNQAKCIRDNAAKAASPDLRKDMEATAVQYELLAESAEQVAKRRTHLD